MKAIQWYTLIMSIAALVINIHTFILQNRLHKRIMNMRKELTPTIYDFEKIYEENKKKVDLSKKDIF